MCSLVHANAALQAHLREMFADRAVYGRVIALAFPAGPPPFWSTVAWEPPCRLLSSAAPCCLPVHPPSHLVHSGLGATLVPAGDFRGPVRPGIEG